MVALIVLVLIVPMGMICAGIFLVASAFRAPSSPPRHAVPVPPAQIATGGRSPLRARSPRHPIVGVLFVVGGTVLLSAGVSAYRALYELAQWFR